MVVLEMINTEHATAAALWNVGLFTNQDTTRFGPFDTTTVVAVCSRLRNVHPYPAALRVYIHHRACRTSRDRRLRIACRAAAIAKLRDVLFISIFRIRPNYKDNNSNIRHRHRHAHQLLRYFRQRALKDKENSRQQHAVGFCACLKILLVLDANRLGCFFGRGKRGKKKRRVRTYQKWNSKNTTKISIKTRKKKGRVRTKDLYSSQYDPNISELMKKPGLFTGHDPAIG